MRYPLALIAIMLVAFELSAQPDDLGYEPPAGWTHVMNLDSVDVLDIHACNDTIVLAGYTLRQPIPPEGRNFSLYSLDGGMSWDTLHLEKYDENTGFLGEGFFPQSNRRYRLLYETDPATFVRLVSMRISYDLGKTYPERYNYDTAMSKALMGVNRRMFFHPLAPDEGFYVRGQSIFYTVFRTHDGGKTWEVQPMPMPRDGNGVFYQILPDVRNPKVWNARVNGADHSWVDDFYQTLDDGKSFSYINQWGEYAGIGYEGEVRSWWATHTYTTVGFISSGDQGDSLKLPWLKRTAPEKPDPDFDGGFQFTIVTNNYKYLEKHPDTAVLVTRDIKWDKPDTITDYKTFMYRTFNDGETWESIWPTYLDINKIFLDQSTHLLWLVSNDSNAKQLYQNFPPQRSLYRQKIFTSVESGNISENFGQNINISPNPSENSTQISFKNSKAGKVEISLHDILGTKLRTIYSGIQEAGEQKLIWNIPAEIPSGTYFLKLESGGKSISEKIVIMR